MDGYFGLLRRHGLILWVSFLVGNLAAGVITGLAILIIFFIGAIALFASVSDQLSAVESDPAIFLDILFSPGILIIGILFLGVILLTSGFTSAGMNTTLREAVFKDRSSIETYFTQGFRYMLKMSGQLLLIFLLFIPVLVLFVGGVVLIGMGVDKGAASSILGGFLLFLVGGVLIIILTLLFLHAPVILVTENRGIWESITLSARLFTHSFGQVLLSGVIVFLINLMFGVFIFLLIALLGIATFDPLAPDSSIGGGIGIQLLSYLIRFALSPFIQMVSLLAVFYRYRHRLRPRLFPEWNGNGVENSGTATF